MIKTWQERCEIHPDHQTGMITYQMIQNRMQEEIDELREALEKTLTDEEINAIADQFKEGEHWKSDVKWVIPESDFVDFARAILRKASEK